jgi:bifunctional UDP-N-acetylglucosamine pyrophosphorylase/glucosamine-1-phosphate N-acetyltransferase
MIVIILAGGKGKRMQSDRPKVLIDIFGKPMLVRLVQRSLHLNPSKILIVIPPESIIQQTIKEYFPENQQIEFVIQNEPLGTGHAVKSCLDILPNNSEKVLVLCGDIPFLTVGLMRKIVDQTDKCGLLTVENDDPKGFGRVLEQDNKIKIIEEKDCNEEQRKIKQINTGIYCMESRLIYQFIPLIQNNNIQKEYYFTDIIGLMNEEIKIQNIKVNPEEKVQVLGVNTKEELEKLLNQL